MAVPIVEAMSNLLGRDGGRGGTSAGLVNGAGAGGQPAARDARPAAWALPPRWTMVRGVRSAVTSLCDLAWPTSCGGCGEWGLAWCPGCEALTPARPFFVHPRAARHLDVMAARPFEGPLRRAVTVFKDEQRRDLLPALSALLRASVAEALCEYGEASTRGMPERWVVLPVPSSRAAGRRRGRFPLGELAARVSGPGIIDGPRLVLTRRVRDQAGLDAEQRRRNSADAFALQGARAWPTAAGAILIDDVVTTGSTLQAAHGALLRAGVEDVVTAVIAATPERGSSAHAGTSPWAPRVSRSDE